MDKTEKRAALAHMYGAGDIKVGLITGRYPNPLPQVQAPKTEKYKSPTGRLHRSEPNMQVIKPALTEGQRRIVNDIKSALAAPMDFEKARKYNGPQGTKYDQKMRGGSK